MTIIENLKSFIRRILRLNNLFRKREPKEQEPIEKAPTKVVEEIDRWSSRKISKRFGRLLKRKSHGPNMPKFQRCPQCHGDAKRLSKSDTGAMYHCRKDKVTWSIVR